MIDCADVEVEDTAQAPRVPSMILSIHASTKFNSNLLGVCKFKIYFLTSADQQSLDESDWYLWTRGNFGSVLLKLADGTFPAL